jgi:tetratricopeptide (TPR) repeat protein
VRLAIDRHGEALRLYALVGQAVGRIDDAIGALKRIAALEGDPPEILGAIADTLGKANRHAEAYDHWSAMIARYPEVVEAHLNRAIAAANANLHDQAVAAADEGLRRFAGDARLLATRAMALKNAGRINESLDAFEIAVAADPERALTRHNHAVALRAACRFEESCEAYAVAERLGAKGAQFHSNWAAAALEAHHVNQAEELYDKALAEDPSHEEARTGLTRLRIEYRGGEGAFAHYEAAAKSRPAQANAWLDWSRALIANRQTAAALAVATAGLASNPGHPQLLAVQAFAEGMTGNASAALAKLDSLLRNQPKDAGVQSLITQIAFRAGHPERAAEVLEIRTAKNPEDQLAWAMLGLAWRLLDDPREFWLYDYDRLVMVTDVIPADGSMSAEEYAAEIASFLDPLHVTTAEPGGQSLRGGTQTSGALFARQDLAIQQFQEAVTIAAEKAVAALPDNPEHPFLRRKSKRLGFSGSWSVRLAAGGHHVSHVHPEGWMSSAFYVRLPANDVAARQRHEGWIQFGVPPEHLGIELPPRRIVEPQPGRLVLFPSFLWHGTIPFGDGDRLTAAFDYQPL